MTKEASNVDALIVGSGPTGLTLGLALLRQGKSVLIVDKHLQGLDFSRAILINSESLQLLEPFGVSQRLRDIAFPVNGISMYVGGKCISRATFNTQNCSHTHPLCLPQLETEACLEKAYLAAGGLLKRGYLFKSFAALPSPSEPGHFTIAPTGNTLRPSLEVTTDWLFGCDGFHSTVRESIHIAYPGDSLSSKPRSLDVRLSHWPFKTNANLFFEPDGVVFAVQMGDDRVRLVATSDAALNRIQSTLPIVEVLWDTDFEVHFHVAEHYGCGQVWLAGDAAHVHSPIGGRGMNMGIADAIALAHAVSTGQLQEYERTRKQVADEWVSFNRTLSKLTLSNRGAWPLGRKILPVLLSLVAHLIGNNLAKKAFSRLSGIPERQLDGNLRHDPSSTAL